MRRISLSILMAVFFSFLTNSLLAQEKRDALREYRLGNFQAAVDVCLEELSENPMNLDSYAVLCWSLVRLGKFDEAALRAERARAINRYDPRIIQILAEARFNQGRNDEALKLFQEYVSLAPEGGRIDSVYFHLGEIYSRLGRFRHADIAYSTAVRYVPGNAHWWTRLAYARERAGDNRYAASAYEKAISLDPQLADAARGLERVRRALAAR